MPLMNQKSIERTFFMDFEFLFQTKYGAEGGKSANKTNRKTTTTTVLETNARATTLRNTQLPHINQSIVHESGDFLRKS